MKYVVWAVSLIVIFQISEPGSVDITVISKGASLKERMSKGCPVNPDSLYNRQEILRQFAGILNKATPPDLQELFKKYVEDERAVDFFVYDLTDTSNKNISKVDCVNFTNNHIYHFAATRIPFSISYIAVLEGGKMKIFDALNCSEGKGDLGNLLLYLNEKLKDDKNKDEIITRVKNYRRYGTYWRVDEFGTQCKESEKIPENPDRLYHRGRVFDELAAILFAQITSNVKYKHFPYMLREEDERGIGFFIYDLTEPTNKQTSLVERIDFTNNHVYHFAYIDLPYSFSNIAILEDGKLKVFKAINCDGGRDKLSDVMNYLKEKLKNDENRNAILKRVSSYRDYGVYTSFNNLSVPQCKEIESKIPPIK